MTETMIERVIIDNRGGGRSQRTLSNHGYQRWQAEWFALAAEGWDVTLLVDRPQTHVIALAARGQLELW
jgi:hypothetical protein